MQNDINNIHLINNKLYLESDMDLTNMCLSKDKSSLILPFTMKNNSIDIKSILEEYAYILPKKGLYAVALNEEKANKIKVNQTAPTGKDYICKNLKLNINNDEYVVDIYINNINQIKIYIEKSIQLEVLVDTVYIENNNLRFDISLDNIYGVLNKDNTEIAIAKEELVKYNQTLDIDLVPTVILVTSILETKTYEAEYIKDNKISYKIDISNIKADKDGIIVVTLVSDKKSINIKLQDAIKFKPLIIPYDKIAKKVIVKTHEENLAIAITSKVNISPKITNVEYIDNKLVIEGNLNSTIDVFKYESYEATLSLISRDKSINIEDTLEINNGLFIYTLTDEEIINLKKIFSGEWDLSIAVKYNDEELTSKEVYYKTKVARTMFSEVIKIDGYDTILEAYLTKEKKRFSLRIKNNMTITQILTMTKKKDGLIVKYRTKENVEKLLDNNQLVTDMFNKEEHLKGEKVKKIGKKTYTVEYKSQNIDKFIEEMIDSGVSLSTKVEGYNNLEVMADINRYAIYNNKWELIQNSKKYKNLCSKLYNKLFLKLPVKKKRVMFESFLGRNVSGNPKYVYEYFVENDMDKEYQLIWILNNTDEEINGKGKAVKRKSLKYYYYMATSGYWVFNARQADEIVKRKDTTYLQTWHGTPLKKLGGDMFNSSMAGSAGVEEYIERFFKNSARWDYLLAQNEYSGEIFERAFNFKKEMIYGYPANDILYTKNNEKDINIIKEKLNIPKDKKVILYAPTWRDDNFYKKGHYKMTMELELDKMQKELGDEYIVLLRTHYLIANSIKTLDYKGFVYDFSEGYDIQELYLVSDILMTDYSSVMFDYANLKRPMVFFAYDLEKYRDNLRGFYFNFVEDAPGPIVMTTDEVIDSVKDIKSVNKNYKEKQKAFYDKFCHVDDGFSGKKIVEQVFFDK